MSISIDRVVNFFNDMCFDIISFLNSSIFSAYKNYVCFCALSVITILVNKVITTTKNDAVYHVHGATCTLAKFKRKLLSFLHILIYVFTLYFFITLFLLILLSLFPKMRKTI